MKNIPLRKCIVSRKQFQKDELVWVVKNKEGIISVDITGKANGRGAYVQKTIEAITKCQTKKLLNRSLGTNVSDAIYDELLELVNKI